VTFEEQGAAALQAAPPGQREVHAAVSHGDEVVEALFVFAQGRDGG